MGEFVGKSEQREFVVTLGIDFYYFLLWLGNEMYLLDFFLFVTLHFDDKEVLSNFIRARVIAFRLYFIGRTLIVLILNSLLNEIFHV